ncbi:MAG: phosphate acyltransferase PlsX [Candidatus Aminicenantes bacterium]|nr:phosphate acyltransferase PlsX [Candidatus Aminicenantes bacterium]
MKVAVDVMGGDFGPPVTVSGALSASREYQLEVMLVGIEDIIKQALDRLDCSGTEFTIVNATESIGMGEGILSFRRKKKSSIVVGTQLVKSKEADAFVSTGNTSAVVFISRRVLGALEGVDRPALSLLIPTLSGSTLLTDVGANVNCTAHHLEQFAHMGRIFMESVLGIENPRIALMSIGEELVKGNDLTREAYNLLTSSSLNFVGNIEGRDMYSGKADVIVSDGFTGNVALKTSEGVIDTLEKWARTEIMKNIFAKVGFLLLKRHLKKIYKRVDYSEYGGAHLLGLNGVCIIGHGRSNPVAVRNAIRLARDYVVGKVQEKIQAEIARMKYSLNGVKA